MNERSIFLEALEKSSLTERSAYLDTTCGSDPALRQRVEALLKSHEEAGAFLEKLAPERLAKEIAVEQATAAMQDGPSGDELCHDDLAFLTPADKPGSLGRLGHYDIQEVVGCGGMGIVLRAFDERLHRVVAIKVMSAQLATSATARKRFQREAQAAAAVSHEHVVTIHAVEEANGRPYLVMQYVAGVSLQERLDRGGALELHEVLRIGLQTAAGLMAAHAHGLIHRDIKPANILLENGVERVKITDFGLARAADDASLTQSGAVAGTPHYMAPEQARGEALDARTDLFSLGSVMYAMCTGRSPFRASGSMAVLKRVCEETPTPIRETNPDVPDWLVAIIDKLHAKDPADRLQSAAEVAELLRRHLAHVQHPSVAPLADLLPLLSPFAPSGREVGGDRKRHGRQRRWALAAAALVLLLGGLSWTEAAGVSNVVNTVIRIFTPHGTLVVDVDDPGVKVTIEGDGGLVITGAGAQEVRVRPGSYKLHADRDGKRVPLERELVSIANGDRTVVRVKLETPPKRVVAKTEEEAFVLLAAGKERKFNTLAEAVAKARSNDTIEIRGNGPFLTDPLDLGFKALTVRAGQGYSPLIRRSRAAEKGRDNAYLLKTQGPLTLEGLNLLYEVSADTPENFRTFPRGPQLVYSLSAPLYLAHCKLVVNGEFQSRVVVPWNSPRGQMRDCLVVAPHSAGVFWGSSPGMRWTVDNCLIAGATAFFLQTDPDNSPGAELRLTRNTLVGGWGFNLGDRLALADNLRETTPKLIVPVIVETEENIFQVQPAFNLYTLKEEQSGIIPKLLGWRECANVYDLGDQPLLQLQASALGLLKDLAEWNEFWGLKDTGSLQGPVLLRGNPNGLLAEAPEAITPDDFRLAEGSTGKGAGPGGKDLGADVDLVGPGPAYERWKKTPEYQQWLKDTRQIAKAEAPKEPNAFVLLGGKGVAVRKFDTLAKAVASSSDGDTIEVRGNGPFDTSPIDIGNQSLTIRAADGFLPVIKLSPEGAQTVDAMLHTAGLLTIEGLEFQRLGQRKWTGTTAYAPTILWSEGALHAANCRFWLDNQPWQACVYANGPVCIARNCEFLAPGSYAVSGTFPSGRLRVMDNCVQVGGYPQGLVHYQPTDDLEMRLTHNTLVSASTYATLHFYLANAPAAKNSGVIRLEATANIFDARPALGFSQSEEYLSKNKLLDPSEVESLAVRLLAWRDRGNLYPTGGPSVQWSHHSPHGPQNVDEWKKFWGDANADASEGKVRYQGGNLVAKLTATPDRITPDDFRLRPDSAGYRAGKDGKDLGADVDLVGPGPAYERWKKTPEYQQWLQDSGQLQDRAAAMPYTGAFELQGGQGVAERKFDTLTEAVASSSDGDTIEVRGNGPFVSDGAIVNHSLVIRASAGYTPSIRLGKESASRNVPLFSAINGRLVLEGLELMRVGGAQGQVEDRFPQLLLAWDDGSLHVANCRLIYKADSVFVEQGAGFTSRAGSLFVRNSVLTGNISTESSMYCESGGRYSIDNCVCAIGGIGFGPADPDVRDVAIRVRNNTLVGNCLNLTLFFKPNLPGASDADQPLRLAFSGNVACWDATARNTGFLYFHQAQKEPLAAVQAEAFLPRLVQLDEEQNVYRTGTPMLRLVADWQPLDGKRGQDLADWNRFWGFQNTGSEEGAIRFQGGDLITRARSAPEELTAEDFRLRPDSAGYRAGKDGKDLGADVDLVGPGPAYERWKKTPEYEDWLKETKQIAKAEAPKEPNAFVVLGREGVAERNFDTLAEAVLNASDGDTIEIRGNGPFVSYPVNVANRSLVIRAAPRYRPVIRLSPEGVQTHEPLLHSQGRLTLEGIEFQRLGQRAWREGELVPCIVYATGSSLQVANCSFRSDSQQRYHDQIRAHTAASQIRNCLFITPGDGGSVDAEAGQNMVLDNCLHVGCMALGLRTWGAGKDGVEMRLSRNTLVTGNYPAINFAYAPGGAPLEPRGSVRPITLEATGNVIHAGHVLHIGTATALALETDEAESMLGGLLNWNGGENVWRVPDRFVFWTWQDGAQPESPHGPGNLNDWKKFWATAETGSIEGAVRYEGGDLMSKLAVAPDKLTPEDFRLRPDSAGYRAGPDGEDLGADVDLVGPGPAYERWKKTPEYQQWLKNTGQLRAEPPTPEPKAFVVLTGKGIEVRKFETLAKAVQGASDGDTIEVRGNGPFLSDSVNLGRTLTIRAGTGFRPVIKLSPEAFQRNVPLLATNAALVLEGLDVYRGAPEDPANGRYAFITTNEAPLRAANCRFSAAIYTIHCPICVFHNCEFLAAGGVGGTSRSASRIVFENCLRHRKTMPLSLVYDDLTVRDVSIEIKRSTYLGDWGLHWLRLLSPLPVSSDGPEVSKAFRFEVSRSIFDAPTVLGFDQKPESIERSAVLSPADAEAVLLRLLQWRGERNLYASGSASVNWLADLKQQPPHGPKSLEEWKQFWGTAETDSLEGGLRFQGGDLQLTPDDFRLRADSAGYRAGPDGKDLGADVDLVGPGPAYERWKKTPEYEQWLTDVQWKRVAKMPP